jgi:hypothetical protein
VALVVEDAQYADAGLLDFLDYLIDWSRDLPIYVLVMARPELGQARPGFGTGRNRTTLTLDPLDPGSMDTLVDALVPEMPPTARAAVTGQAQGIPLFAVETVRALIDRDIVRPVEGVYRLTGDIGELVVPDSLHGLLAARLDALDPGLRRLVADAAVLGTTFPAEALIAVSGQDEAAVRAALAELVRREVFTVSADPLSPERGSYGFTQNMLRPAWARQGLEPGRPIGRGRSRRAAVGRRTVGTRRRSRQYQRQLGPGRRASGPGPRLPPAGRADPGGGSGSSHRRVGTAHVGPPDRSARATDLRPRRAAGRSGHRHGRRAVQPGGSGELRRLARRRPYIGRSAVPRPGLRRRRY